MTAPRARLKPEKASLVGGIVIAIAAMVLWVAATRELGFQGLAVLALGAGIAVAAGVWTRLADL